MACRGGLLCGGHMTCRAVACGGHMACRGGLLCGGHMTCRAVACGGHMACGGGMTCRAAGVWPVAVACVAVACVACAAGACVACVAWLACAACVAWLACVAQARASVNASGAGPTIRESDGRAMDSRASPGQLPGVRAVLEMVQDAIHTSLTRSSRQVSLLYFSSTSSWVSAHSEAVSSPGMNSACSAWLKPLRKA